jgi:hypothetical protein
MCRGILWNPLDSFIWMRVLQEKNKHDAAVYGTREASKSILCLKNNGEWLPMG